MMETAKPDDEPLSRVGEIDRRADEAEPSLVEELGARAIELWQVGAGIGALLMRTLHYCMRGRREPGAVVRQMFEIGNRSVFFLTVVMGFIGMILVLQSGLQVQRILPEFSLLGATYIELLVRDLSVSISALMLATRVGAGIAAEIGSMVVTEQVDALRMCAADPVDYLIKPRFVASILMTVCLVVWATGIAILTGMLTGYVMFDISFRTFWNLRLLDAGDLIICLTKCIAYGAAIPIVAGHSGLNTHGGSEGVGWATTRAVVNASLAVIMLDLVISALGFVVFGP